MCSISEMKMSTSAKKTKHKGIYTASQIQGSLPRFSINPNGVPYGAHLSVRGFEGKLSILSLTCNLRVDPLNQPSSEKGTAEESVTTLLRFKGGREEYDQTGTNILQSPSLQKDDIRLIRRVSAPMKKTPDTTYELYVGPQKIGSLPHVRDAVETSLNRSLRSAVRYTGPAVALQIDIHAGQNQKIRVTCSSISKDYSVGTEYSSPVLFESGGDIYIAREGYYESERNSTRRGCQPQVTLEGHVGLQYFSEMLHTWRHKSYLFTADNVVNYSPMARMSRPTWEVRVRGVPLSPQTESPWASDDFLSVMIPFREEDIRVSDNGTVLSSQPGVDQKTQSALWGFLQYEHNVSTNSDTQKDSAFLNSFQSNEDRGKTDTPSPTAIIQDTQYQDSDNESEGDNATESSQGTSKKERYLRLGLIVIVGILCVLYLVEVHYVGNTLVTVSNASSSSSSSKSSKRSSQSLPSTPKASTA